MKIIKYKHIEGVNYGTEDNPNFKSIIYPCEIRCAAENLESNIAIVKQEAYNGEYSIEDDGQPEPESIAPVTWAALAAAYSEGVNEA